MLGNRPAQESELVGPICARFGLSVENSRLLISEGRKVGFVVDCGSLPLSVRCFVEEFPTPSTSLERNSSRGKALCFLPKGFKVVGLVEGSVYLGEVVYDENWKRSYKFHLVEGPEIVKSSMPCSNPTSAFKEIEAVIKVQTTKKRHRKPDARSNGKLYMAVMYSATQRLLREKFRGCESKVPEDVRPIFIEWLENRSSNKAFAAGSHDISTVVPMPQNMKTSLPPPLPRHSSAPAIARPASNGEREPEGTHSNDYHFMSLDDAHIDSFFTGADASFDLNGSRLAGIPTARKRSSGSVDDYAHLLSSNASSSDNFASASSRKRSSGSIDEHSPMLLTRKRASGSIDEDSSIFKDMESLSQSNSANAQQSNTQPSSSSTFGAALIPDAGELFADCFKLTDDGIEGHPPTALSSISEQVSFSQITSSFSSPMMGFDESKEQGINGTSNGHNLSTNELYQCLREPHRELLSPAQVRSAIAMLLQLPTQSVSLRHVEDIAKGALQPGKSNLAFERFLNCLEERERDIVNSFSKLEAENAGHVTMDTLYSAKAKGMLKGIELDMEELQEKMDGLTFSRGNRSNGSFNERRLAFEQFKTLVLPLPFSSSLRTVMELVRNSLTDSIELETFTF